MEEKDFDIKDINEIYRLIEEVEKSGKIKEDDEENPGKFLSHLDDVMLKVSQLVNKCKDLSDDSSDSEDDKGLPDFPFDFTKPKNSDETN